LKIQTLESLKIGRTDLSAEGIDLLRTEFSSLKIDFRGIERRTTNNERNSSLLAPELWFDIDGAQGN